jgi:hypothetical protein
MGESQQLHPGTVYTKRFYNTELMIPEGVHSNSSGVGSGESLNIRLDNCNQRTTFASYCTARIEESRASKK